MMARWNERLFPVLEEQDIGFVAFSPLANGFLTTVGKGAPTFAGSMDYRSKMPQYSQEGREKAQPLLELIEQLAKAKHASPAQITLAWVLAQKPYIVPIPGSSKAERIRENAEAASITFTQDELREIATLLDGVNLQVFGEQEKTVCNFPHKERSIKEVRLNDDNLIPAVGFGVFLIPNEARPIKP